MKITKGIAECVGLWLAEGDNKSNNEITFTNNCYFLILHFDSILRSIFDTPNKRLYIYSAPNQNSKKDNILFPITREYGDVRARKPYYIWRLASVEKMKIWKKIVSDTLSNEENGADVLRGFFAGEGSVKIGSHNQRVLRIAQKCEKSWINNILNCLDISYHFALRQRIYEVSGKWNWDIFAKYKLADLHPDKKTKFWNAYRDFKQDHYKTNYLLNKLLSDLNKPETSRLLAHKYNRSQYRISEILSELKKRGLVKNFRVQSKDYWINSQSPFIIVSKTKEHCLKELREDPKSAAELSKLLNRSQRAIGKRLTEMQRLSLVKRDKFNKWTYVTNSNKIIVK